MQLLNSMGIGDYYRFDQGIVRGLAYYTGNVFEIYDKASELRAICGGGRYDNLLKDFGGPAISATGMGMVDRCRPSVEPGAGADPLWQDHQLSGPGRLFAAGKRCPGLAGASLADP